MPLFVVSDYEEKVQAGDATRVDCTRSFASTGTTAATTMTIKPGKTPSAIDCFTNKYLDYAFEFTIEVDATNNKLNFSEGGAELTATISTDEYTLAEMATELKTQLDAAGALTYTVAVDSDTNVFTISATGEFELLVNSGTNAATSIFSHIGFTDDSEDLDGDSEYDSERVESVERTITVVTTNGALEASDSTTELIYIDVLSEA